MIDFNGSESDLIECELCYDCKWVLNDSLHMPFSALVLDALIEGDEIIRCTCNEAPSDGYSVFHPEGHRRCGLLLN